MTAPSPDQPVQPVKLFGAACALGYPHPGSAEAPDRIRQALYDAWAEGRLAWAATLRTPAGATGLDALAAYNRRLARVIAYGLGSGFGLVLGGDHAIAPGTWAGVTAALGEPPGLIWIDAHLDAHTPATSLSGNAHGMALAFALGQGPQPLARPLPVGTPLDPARVTVIGARQWETAERELLDRLGVRIIDAQELAGRGLADAVQEALARIGTRPFGVSLDLDVFDPRHAPGVNTPVAGGLAPEPVGRVLAELRAHNQFKLLELVEYNPRHDRQARTLATAVQLIRAVLGPPAVGRPTY